MERKFNGPCCDPPTNAWSNAPLAQAKEIMRKTFHDRIVNPGFMRQDTLATKTMSGAIGFRTRAISVYILTSEALNGLFIHGQNFFSSSYLFRRTGSRPRITLAGVTPSVGFSTIRVASFTDGAFRDIFNLVSKALGLSAFR